MQLHEKLDIDDAAGARLDVPALLPLSDAFMFDALAHGNDSFNEARVDRLLIHEGLDHTHHTLGELEVSSDWPGAQEGLSFPQLPAMLVVVVKATHADHQWPLIPFRSQPKIDTKHRAITAHASDGLHEPLGDFVIGKLPSDGATVGGIIVDEEQIEIGGKIELHPSQL